MTPAALEALKQSILKWEQNTKINDLNDASLGKYKCPLCQLFIESDCEGCPIMLATGETFCEETPYEVAREAENLAEFHSAAKAELEFLKSLLPESHK